MFTVFLGQDKSVPTARAPQAEHPGEAALTSAAGKRACKTPAFSQRTGATWLKWAKKGHFLNYF